MPLYVYKCVNCGTEVEKLLPMGAEAPKCCGIMEYQWKPSMNYKPNGKSARRRWCESWTPDSKSFKFGDWRDKTKEAEKIK